MRGWKQKLRAGNYHYTVGNPTDEHTTTFTIKRDFYNGGWCIWNRDETYQWSAKNFVTLGDATAHVDRTFR